MQISSFRWTFRQPFFLLIITKSEFPLLYSWVNFVHSIAHLLRFKKIVSSCETGKKSLKVETVNPSRKFSQSSTCPEPLGVVLYQGVYNTDKKRTARTRERPSHVLIGFCRPRVNDPWKAIWGCSLRAGSWIAVSPHTRSKMGMDCGYCEQTLTKPTNMDLIVPRSCFCGFCDFFDNLSMLPVTQEVLGCRWA